MTLLKTVTARSRGEISRPADENYPVMPCSIGLHSRVTRLPESLLLFQPISWRPSCPVPRIAYASRAKGIWAQLRIYGRTSSLVPMVRLGIGNCCSLNYEGFLLECLVR